MILNNSCVMCKAFGLALIAMIANSVAALDTPNIVGYMSCDVNQGENFIPMPNPVGASLMYICDVLEQGGLLEGDVIQAVGPSGEIVPVKVFDGGGFLYSEDEFGLDADMYELPKFGDRYVLKVTRPKAATTNICVAGEFSGEVPLRIPMITRKVPLSKIRIDEESAKELTGKRVLLILKNGERRTVEVGSDRLIVDASTGEVLEEDIGMIKAFDVLDKDEVKDINARNDVARMRNAIATGTRKYNYQRELIEVVAGIAWDGSRPWLSLIKVLGAIIAAAGAGKFGDWMLKGILLVLKYLFGPAQRWIQRRKMKRREKKVAAESVMYNRKAHFAQ